MEIQELMQNRQINNLLNELKIYHPETYEHCVRVGKLCIKMGKKNNFNEEEIKLLGKAGLLHDIGKLDISLDILDKESELNNEERKIIEEHSKKGFDKLDLEKVNEIILHHHSHQKNNYPRDLHEKKNICKLAQIVAVCDMFDALANKRSYKEKFSKEKVKDILEKEFTGEEKFVTQIFELGY